jgi:hypothetical protein
MPLIFRSTRASSGLGVSESTGSKPTSAFLVDERIFAPAIREPNRTWRDLVLTGGITAGLAAARNATRI